MKNQLKILTCLGMALCLAAEVRAQLPVSQPSMILRTQLSSNALRMTSIPFTRDPVIRAVVTAVSGNTLTLSDASGLNLLTGTHTVQFVTGNSNAKFRTISSFPATNQVTYSGTALSVTANFDEVVIFPNHTLNTLFPSGSEFQPGANPASADRLFIVVSGALRSYYYNNVNNKWQFADSTSTADQGGVVFDFNSGILMRGAPSTTGFLKFGGVARSGTLKQDYNTTALRFVSLRNFESGMTLNTSPFTGVVVTGANPASADRVFFVVSGALRSFYYNNINNKWQFADSISVADQGGVAIPADGAFLLRPTGTTLQTIQLNEYFVP